MIQGTPNGFQTGQGAGGEESIMDILKRLMNDTAYQGGDGSTGLIAALNEAMGRSRRLGGGFLGGLGTTNQTGSTGSTGFNGVYGYGSGGFGSAGSLGRTGVSRDV